MSDAASPSAKSILVVDDDPDMRNLIARALRTKYAVYEASDGLAAMRSLEERRPDLIVADVMMPQLDGYAMARHLKSYRETSHIPIIFLTAKSNPLDIVDGINAGARHYMTKPFKVAELLGRVGKLLG
jgi:DNA-binding response OmpR family regulator